MTQRDYMRKLAKLYGRDNRDKIVREYAKAEMKGLVHRKRGTKDTSPYEYAFHLWHDMVSKGW